MSDQNNHNDNHNEKLKVLDDEKKLLLDHNYDGIHELDNPLPAWWRYIFYISVVFGIIYVIYYQFGSGPSLRDEFNKDFSAIQAIKDQLKAKSSSFNADQFAAVNNPTGIKKGEEIFTNNCMVCHAEKGKGDVGPNLTDEYWLRAKGTPDTIFNVVYNGSVDNGMPAWSESISVDEIYLAVAYVYSLKNTHQPGGKEPQGEKIE